jgi:hypothetical protein
MKKRLATWATVKTSLVSMDRAGLMGVIHDLYETSAANQRFLHARFVQTAPILEEYRRLVRTAVFPDPLSGRAVRLRDAATAISDYRRASGDASGTVDLMLEFVEAGTELAADLGYGDDAYFSALERKIEDIVKAMDALPDADLQAVIERLIDLGAYQRTIGWGYGDFVGDVAARMQARRRESSRPGDRLPKE